MLLPTHNRAHLLGRAVRSVLGQTYRELELLIVDDGSTDGTPALVEGLRDERVRSVRLDVRAGAPRARNEGLARARGELIAFQDSDDEWHAEKLARQVERFEGLSRGTAVSYSAILRIMSTAAVRIPRHDEERSLSGDLRSSLVVGNFISTQTAVVRSDALRAVGGFDERLPRLQDWDLWLTLSERYLFDFLDEVTVTAYETADSITLDRSAYAPALEWIAEKHDRLFRREPAVRANIHMSLAVLAAHERRVRAAARFFGRGLAASPRAALARAAGLRGVSLHRRRTTLRKRREK